MSEILLGVNVDHVATLRQARRTVYPDPLTAALLAEEAGADGITIHLREDRRHILDSDVERFRETLTTRLNLEMAMTEEMLEIALRVKPDFVCLVPEKREELTTEGGLAVAEHLETLKPFIERLQAADIAVSLFIDPDERQITAAFESGAPYIELHTGAYAENPVAETLKVIENAAHFAADKGLKVNAGHGLHYYNVTPIAAIEPIIELNIGHAIVAEAVFIGFEAAVSKMKNLMQAARQ